MTYCVMKVGHCQCQPDEGMACPHGTPAEVQAALNKEIMRLRAALVEVGEWGNQEGSVAEEYDQDHGPGSFKKLTRGSTP